MRKKLLLASFFSLASLLFIHPYVYTSSNGAPIRNTGAPGESTCAQSGCHSGNPVNSGNGNLSIRVLDNGTEVNNFINGKTYSVEVKLAKADAERFGFQTTVKGTNAGGGTLAASGTDVQKIGSYVTHTNPNPHHNGEDIWTFEWTAPASGAGNVIFYTAGNAANGNNTTTGDFIYTTSKTLSPDATSLNEQTLFSENMRIFPNPVQNVAGVHFTTPNGSNTNATLQIFSVEGKLLETINQPAKAFINNTIYADLSGYKTGVYLAKLNVGDFSEVKKIFKN